MKYLSPEQHDHYVILAKKLFRDCGFDIGAMRYPRCAEALSGLKKFNGLSDQAKVPFAWNYFPNEYFRCNWQKYY